MAKDDKGMTPMMKQFFSMKAQHPDALMLFRCGDFYETYAEDAIEAARILGITLTRRNNGGNSGSTEMAGFPHHALDTYLPKLIRAGKRVAICDQLEDPKKKREAIKGKKGLTAMDKMVKRGITELVTPGVALSDNVLNYKENNFLAAVHFSKGACGVSFLDISFKNFSSGSFVFVNVFEFFCINLKKSKEFNEYWEFSPISFKTLSFPYKIISLLKDLLVKA